jgi:hypothetical protein
VPVVLPADEVGRRTVLPADVEDLAVPVVLADVMTADDDAVADARLHD